LHLCAATGSVVAICTNTTISGMLSVTDDITAFWTSDERLKDNITPIDDPLAKVLTISGNTFDWNEKSNKNGHDVGLIAQEIEQVLPEAVTTRDNGYLAVDYHKVVPLLVEAIKELSAKVESLEQKLSDK
jgi:CRISPR/Cas system type I-B associated protein Csh2 (Cas7 group RAMP superfamily)